MNQVTKYELNGTLIATVEQAPLTEALLTYADGRYYTMSGSDAHIMAKRAVKLARKASKINVEVAEMAKQAVKLARKVSELNAEVVELNAAALNKSFS